MSDIFHGCYNFKQSLDSWQIDNIISTLNPKGLKLASSQSELCTSSIFNNNQLNWCV